MDKEILSRTEFQSRTEAAAREMYKDRNLLNDALDVKVRAGHDYMWVHQTRWMGEPCLQLTTDMLALAEIIYETKPSIIIESGVAWGGTTLFLASLLNLVDGKFVIGIDNFIPDDLSERIMSKGEISRKVKLINGSSIDVEIISSVGNLLSPSDQVMVILDSDHTYKHVLQELREYSKFVTSGQYLICCDTAIEFQPPAPLRPRDWGKGNSPKTAIDEFLGSEIGDNFSIDKSVDMKLLMSNNWGGYLLRK